MKTFREFLEMAARTGQLETIGGPVPVERLPAMIRNAEYGKNPVLYIARCLDYPYSIAANVYGSPRRVCQAVGVADLAELAQRIDRAVQDAGQPAAVDSEPEDYRIIRKPDLLQFLPKIIHSRFDAGPYLTSGVALVRHPETNLHHCCYVRMGLKGGNTISFNPATPRIKAIAQAVLGQHRQWEIAIVIGAPPSIAVMGAMGLPGSVDDLAVAQALQPDTLTLYHTPIPVPQTTEFVLFGRVLPEFVQEGPIGDFKGTYSDRPNPIAEIDELWVRANAVFHGLRGGVSREHMSLLTLKAAMRLERVRKELPAVAAYHFPTITGGRLCTLTVAEGFPRENVIEALVSIPLVRCFILLNNDVSLHSEEDILWALTQRTERGKDFLFPSRLQSPVLPEKIIIDATVADLSDWNNRRIQVFEL